jgi:hypothetical protein
MRKMDEDGLFLCRFQADLFKYSVKQNISSKLFIKDFSYSNLSFRMNSNDFLFESLDVPAAFIEVEKMENKRKSGIVYNEAIIGWIGYIYRYICYIYEKNMKSIYKVIKPQELYDIYDSYHSMDNELAISRILEAKNINFNKNTDISIVKKHYKL